MGDELIPVFVGYACFWRDIEEDRAFNKLKNKGILP